MMSKKGNYISPYLAGIGIGLTLLFAFVIAGRGLGASSAFSILSGIGLQMVNPDYAGNLTYFSRYLNVGSPLKVWIVFEIGGIFIGALIGAAMSRNFKFQLDKSSNMNTPMRVIAAFAGGAIMGFAARLARGCTSGVALSGGAQLVIGGWIFVIAMFISGFALAAIFRRLWS